MITFWFYLEINFICKQYFLRELLEDNKKILICQLSWLYGCAYKLRSLVIFFYLFFLGAFFGKQLWCLNSPCLLVVSLVMGLDMVVTVLEVVVVKQI